MYSRRVRSGYTLIELLVVMAIIVLLATTGLVIYSGTTKKLRDSKRRAELRDLKLALEQYYSTNNSYPSTGGAWWGESTWGGSRTTNYVPGLVPGFMKSLPNDPHANQANGACCPSDSPPDFGYWYKSDGQDYIVQAWCTPETAKATDTSDAFFDPTNPGCSWQISSARGPGW